MIRVWTFMLLTMGVCFATKAQTTQGKTQVQNEITSPSSTDPGTEKEYSERRVSKKKAGKSFVTYGEKIEEYERRLKANQKKYKKIAKGMKAPQYSDPTYFGHKKKPKKRPPGKKKYCEECGIIH